MFFVWYSIVNQDIFWVCFRVHILWQTEWIPPQGIFTNVLITRPTLLNRRPPSSKIVIVVYETLSFHPWHWCDHFLCLDYNNTYVHPLWRFETWIVLHRLYIDDVMESYLWLLISKVWIYGCFTQSRQNGSG